MMGRGRLLRRTGMLLALLILVKSAGAQCHYNVEVFQAVPCNPLQSPTYGKGINVTTGAVVGYYSPCVLGLDQAFVNIGGSGVTPLPLPPAVTSSRAYRITDGGAILGQASFPPMSAFLLQGSNLQIMGTLPGGDSSSPGSVNSRHVVVGSWGNFVTGPNPLAFRWENGVMQNLHPYFRGYTRSAAMDINEDGVITGYMYPGTQFLSHAFIWNNGVVTDLGTPFPECLGTQGWAINNRNQVCGLWYKGTLEPFNITKRAFFWDGRQMIDLGIYATDTEEYAWDLNDFGIIVGSSKIWRNGNWYPIAPLLVPGSGLSMGQAYSINDIGQMAGTGRVGSNNDVGVRLTPTGGRTGDYNCDERVNVDDLLGVINRWGRCPSNPFCAGDMNNDRFVNIMDLMIVIEHWD